MKIFFNIGILAFIACGGKDIMRVGLSLSFGR
jgi:hypothetical protein